MVHFNPPNPNTKTMLTPVRPPFKLLLLIFSILHRLKFFFWKGHELVLYEILFLTRSGIPSGIGFNPFFQRTKLDFTLPFSPLQPGTPQDSTNPQKLSFVTFPPFPPSCWVYIVVRAHWIVMPPGFDFFYFLKSFLIPPFSFPLFHWLILNVPPPGGFEAQSCLFSPLRCFFQNL